MKKAQAILEYAMVIAVAAAALMAMHVYVQRSVQSNLRLIDDRITAAPADATNLPGPGSGPGPGPISGEWADEVAGAIKVNGPFADYGYYYVFNVGIAKGSTTYFLLDPKGFGIPFATLMPDGNRKTQMSVRIEEATIGDSTFNFDIFELDSNDNLLYTWPTSLGTGGIYRASLKKYTEDKYNSGVKFLLRAVETGTSDTTMNVKWW